jgi:type IX secretion system PorP/SprF family membrane protein
LIKLYRTIYLSGFLLLCCASVQAQNYPLYNQFLANPYFYNPSFAANNGYSELNLLYRKQWSGIDDSPEVNGVALQYATHNNISLGFNFYTEKSVVYKSSSGMLTFAYKVPLTSDSYLKFGLSGGLGVSSLDMNAINEAGTNAGLDPALANAAGTTYALRGNFGVHYRYKNFTVGFALPNIFESQENDTMQVNDVKVSRLSDKLFTLSYKAKLNDKFTLEPYVLYRRLNAVQDQKEASVMLYYRDQIWVGGGYRLNYGPTMTVGLAFKSFIRVGYSYEIPASQKAISTYGSHEVQLQVRLGKMKGPKSKATGTALTPEELDSMKAELDSIKTAKQEADMKARNERLEREEAEAALAKERKERERLEKETRQAHEKDNAVVPPATEPVDPTVPVTPDKSATETKKKTNEPIKLTPPDHLSPGIYVVVGAFKSHENALEYQHRALAAGFPTQLGIGKKGLYYVYVYTSNYLESSRKMRDHIRQLRVLDFKKAWVMEID